MAGPFFTTGIILSLAVAVAVLPISIVLLITFLKRSKRASPQPSANLARLTIAGYICIILVSIFYIIFLINAILICFGYLTKTDENEEELYFQLFYFGAFNLARSFMSLEILILMIIFLVRLRTVFRNSMFDYSQNFYKLLQWSIGLLIILGIVGLVLHNVLIL